MLTDVAEVTDCLKRGAEDLHMGLKAKKKPRFSSSGKGILESELVRLPILLIGPPEEAMARLQNCVGGRGREHECGCRQCSR